MQISTILKAIKVRDKLLKFHFLYIISLGIPYRKKVFIVDDFSTAVIQTFKCFSKI